MPLTPEERAQAVKELYGPQMRPSTEPALPPMTPEQFELMEKIKAERERQLAEQLRRQQLEQERRALEALQRQQRLIKGNTLPGMFEQWMKGNK